MPTRNFPFDALQKAIFVRLTDADNDVGIGGTISTALVFDDVAEGQEYPYVVIGEFGCTHGGSKQRTTSEVTAQIHVWSDADGFRFLNDVLDAIYESLTRSTLDLSADGFTATNAQLEYCQAFRDQEETRRIARHGVLRIRWFVTNTG